MKGYIRMKKIKIALILFLTVTISGSLFSQSSPGVTFLRMPVGSRAQAMGEAYTALSNDANGIFYNPAGMGFGFYRELMLSHSEWFQDIAIENIAFLYPFKGTWTVGAGFSYLHMPELTRYTVDPATGGPLEDGKFSVYNMVITTGVSVRLNDYIALGTNIKFYQDHLESVSAQGIAFDVGIQTRLRDTGLQVGFALQHLGPSVTYLAAKESLPLTYRLGMAYKFRNIDGTIAMDVVKSKGREVHFLPGIEFGFLNSFYLRSGYQITEREGMGLTAGFGLKVLDRHKINYVYIPYGDLGNTHRAELIFSFGTRGFKTTTAKTEKTTRNDEAVTEINNQLKPEQTGSVRSRHISRTTNNSSYQRLTPPSGVKLVELNNEKMMLTWNSLPGRNIKYLIYAKRAGNADWIKVTSKPISETYQIFNTKKSGIKLIFVVTAISDDKESDFSDAVELQM